MDFMCHQNRRNYIIISFSFSIDPVNLVSIGSYARRKVLTVETGNMFALQLKVGKNNSS